MNLDNNNITLTQNGNIMRYSFGIGFRDILFHQNRKSKLLTKVKNNPCKIHMYRESEIYDNIIRIEP